jgi:hypothetical protein
VEGKYTKISALVGVFALLIAIFQVYPRSTDDYSFIRETNGTFTGTFAGDTFTGNFSSTASDSRGKISCYKV